MYSFDGDLYTVNTVILNLVVVISPFGKWNHSNAPISFYLESSRILPSIDIERVDFRGVSLDTNFIKNSSEEEK